MVIYFSNNLKRLLFICLKLFVVKMVGMSTCSVPSCKHRVPFNKCVYSKFPQEFLRCKEWVRVIGNEKLLYLSVKELHDLRFVCSCHFLDSDYPPPKKKRLSNTAVPSILLKCTPIAEEVMEKFPLPKHLRPSVVKNSVQCEELQKLNKITRTFSLSTANTTLPISSKDVCKTNSDEISTSIRKRSHSNVEHGNNNTKSEKVPGPQIRRYRTSVATQYYTNKKLLEEAGIPGAEITSEIKALLSLGLKDKKTISQLKADLEKKTKECEKLQDKVQQLSNSRHIVPLVIAVDTYGPPNGNIHVAIDENESKDFPK